MSRAGRSVLTDQRRRFRVHVRVDQLFQRLVDDLADLFHPPALTELGYMITDLGHLLFVGTTETEHELGIRRLHHVSPGNQAITIERTAERQGTGLGDDGLVKIEECGAGDHGGQV